MQANSLWSKAEKLPQKCSLWFYDKQALYFSIGYESFIIEVSIETLLYDIGSFLAAVGGNLGLFLGFSCLSVLLGFVSMFKKLRKFK